MAKKSEAQEEKVFQIRSPNRKLIKVAVLGIKPLLQHCFSKKTEKQMAERQAEANKTRRAKQPRNPFSDFVHAAHWLTPMPANPTQEDVDKATFFCPGGYFKGAMIEASRFVEGLSMTEARMLLWVMEDKIEIISPAPPQMDTRPVRIGNGKTSDLRYRPIFEQWGCIFTVRYNADILQAEDVLNLLAIAGDCGVGENRPSKSKTGDLGMFRPATIAEVEKLKPKGKKAPKPSSKIAAG